MEEHDSRKAFEDTKQKFCQQSQPGDAIVVAAHLKAWLEPELQNVQCDYYEWECDHDWVWYREAYRWLSLTDFESLQEDQTKISEPALLACQLFLASASKKDLNCVRILDAYYVPVVVVERCWMSVARVAWMAAVVRGIIRV